MPLAYHDLSFYEVAAAAALVLINGVISICLKLRLERLLFIASIRTVVQLLLIGFLLEKIFEQNWWLAIVLLMLTMSLIAGVSAVRRAYREGFEI